MRSTRHRFLWAFAAGVLVATTAAANPKLHDVMAEGKTQTDLGQPEAASQAFQRVIDAPDATPAQRAEALVRLGAARRAAGDHGGAFNAFERASKAPGLDRELKRVLVRALGAALPGDDRWEKVWADVSFTVDRANVKEPALVVGWPGVLPSRRYKGEPISLDHKDADLNDVFRLFADISDQNVVVFPGAQGKVTFKAHEKPWDWCLEQILNANGLTHRWEGNVVLIGTPEQLGTPRPFSGKAIEMVHYQNDDLRQALADLARQGGADLEVDPVVAGRITIRLEQVPWDQAFDVIVKVNGLDWSREGQALKVFPRAHKQRR